MQLCAPHVGPVEVGPQKGGLLEVSALQVDKRAGHMAIWAYEHEVPFARLLGERFQPFAERGTPESSILIEYKWEVSMQGLKPWTSLTLHSSRLACRVPSAL